MLLSHSPVAQGQHAKAPLMLLVALGLAESAKAPRLQMLLSHSPVASGQRSKALLMLLIALGLAEQHQKYSKLQMVMNEVSRWPGSARCATAQFSVRQVLSPGGAGVVSRWCRLAPGSPDGAGWLQVSPGVVVP